MRKHGHATTGEIPGCSLMLSCWQYVHIQTFMNFEYTQSIVLRGPCGGCKRMAGASPVGE